jgi:hypothetical protein
VVKAEEDSRQCEQMNEIEDETEGQQHYCVTMFAISVVNSPIVSILNNILCNFKTMERLI